MRAFLALLLVPLSSCITLSYEQTNIISKSKVELSPIFITCGLNDIVIIAAPVVDSKSLYYLHKPNSDVIKLTLHTTKNRTNHRSQFDLNDNMVVKYINSDVKSMYPTRNRRVISTTININSEDVIRKAELSMEGNEFMIGPLMEEDYGNWVLSVYFKDIDDMWMELFQVITMNIVELVPLVPERPHVHPGDTFRLSFAYPITNLKSCELTAPHSSFDRFFDRTKIELDRCGYVVHNMTKQDEGVWRIMGVGNIVFEGHANLYVEHRHKKRHRQHRPASRFLKRLKPKGPKHSV